MNEVYAICEDGPIYTISDFSLCTTLGTAVDACIERMDDEVRQFIDESKVRDKILELAPGKQVDIGGVIVAQQKVYS